MRKLGDCQFKTFTVSALNATLPSWSKICVWKKKQGIKKGFYSTWVFLLFQRYEFYLRDKIAAVFPSTVGHTNSAVFYWQTCRRHVPASAFFSFFFFTEKQKCICNFLMFSPFQEKKNKPNFIFIFVISSFPCIPFLLATNN